MIDKISLYKAKATDDNAGGTTVEDVLVETLYGNVSDIAIKEKDGKSVQEVLIQTRHRPWMAYDFKLREVKLVVNDSRSYYPREMKQDGTRVMFVCYTYE